MKNTKKTVDKRQKDIQKKLSAAVLMLLVSSIMMVSSTYAWFTLSTAPEVTGIQTTIGGNGNLEIALAGTQETTNGDTVSYSIKAPSASAEGDSIAKDNSIVRSNTTWGNIVQLTQTTDQGVYDPYGLGTIKLYPSKLNVSKMATGNDKVNNASWLMTPTYGADGRVNELMANISSGVYDSATNAFKTTGYGVRGFGVQSSKTERQFAYTGAIASINGNMANAESLVEKALSTSGPTLTDIAIAIGLNENVFTKADVEALGKLITDTKQSLPYIESSISSIINAIIASEFGQKTTDGGLGIDDTKYMLIADTLATLDIDTKVTVGENNVIKIDLGDLVETNPTFTEATLGTAIKNYQTVSANLTAATNKVEEVLAKPGTDGTYTLSQMEEILEYVMNVSTEAGNRQVTVETFTLAEIKADPTKYAVTLAGAMSPEGSGLDIDLNENSGAFYDIATLIGSISSRFRANVDVTYGSNHVEVDNALIIISSKPKNAAYLTTLQQGVLAFGEPKSASSGTTSKIDDLYAFALDLYFRTNANGSNLKLQTEAVNRIYEDSSNSQTMGSGSSMTFTFDQSLTEAMVKNLMRSIKIVFISGDEDTKDEILATAQLDSTNPKIDGYSVTANMYLVDKETSTLDTEGNLSILELTQNQAHQVSVLVYLDGETITNSDVATAATSLTGTMNLQFASDANLKPMEYTEFMQGDVKPVSLQLQVKELSINGMDGSLYDYYLVYKGASETTEHTEQLEESPYDLTDILKAYTTVGDTVALKVKTFEKGANPTSAKALATSAEITYTVE